MKNFIVNLKLATGGIIIMLFYFLVSILTAGPYFLLVIKTSEYLKTNDLAGIYLLFTIIPVILLGAIQFMLYEFIQNSSIWKKIKKSFVNFFLI